MNSPGSSRIKPCHPLHLIIGLVLWSKWFVILYGGLSVACAVVPPPPEQGALTAINAWLGVLTLVTGGLLGWLCWVCLQAARQESGLPRFVAAMSSGLYAASLIATLFVGVPVIGLPPCL